MRGLSFPKKNMFYSGWGKKLWGAKETVSDSETRKRKEQLQLWINEVIVLCLGCAVPHVSIPTGINLQSSCLLPCSLYCRAEWKCANAVAHTRAHRDRSVAMFLAKDASVPPDQARQIGCQVESAEAKAYESKLAG